jgi:erythritol kinase (D-erythritol 1-phosphate-forming)
MSDEAKANAGIFIGIDAGTSVIKSVAFSETGEQLATASAANSYATLSNGGVEQDMQRTWTDTLRTLQQLGEKIPDLANRLIAISVTGQGDGMWLIDGAGEPVAPAWLWLDGRCKEIVESYTSSPAYAAHYKRTGTGVNVCQMNVQLAWMQRHAPATLAKATTAFHCKDWIYFKLTGIRATDPSEANFTFGNYRTRKYQPDILNDLDVAECERLLPPIVDGTTTCHPMAESVAEAAGLKAGTPICLAYVDVICTGLGGGLYEASGNSGCTIIGSTGMHMRLKFDVDQVALNSEKSGYTMVFPEPSVVAQIQSNMASTLNIDWLLDLARGILLEHGQNKSRSEILASIDQKILDRKAASLLYHPYVSKSGERGPFMEPAARASFIGINQSTDYFDMMRAIFEGLAFAARDCYLATGGVPDEVRITGGAAKSIAMRSILASALNTPVRCVEREEAGAAGAAMIAAVQQKRYQNMQSCAEQWVQPFMGPLQYPDATCIEYYNTQFDNYVNTRKALLPTWREMATIGKGTDP